MKSGNAQMAIFLDLSRINHSCIPNAKYDENHDKEQLELYSVTRIRAGEEVTICYGQDFEFKTGVERNAHLRCLYGFTCKCRACADPVFAALSDRRRSMLKNDFFCGMQGMPTAPDFSAKALGIEDPDNIRPTKTTHLAGGFANSFQIFRPGTIQLMRRAQKLKFDEGLLGGGLMELNMYASFHLCVLQKRITDSRGAAHRAAIPMHLLPDLQRCLPLMLASEILLRKMTPPEDVTGQAILQSNKNQLRMWNVVIQKEMTEETAQHLVTEIMSKKPDPFSKNPAGPLIFLGIGGIN
jgi:SET domain